MFVKNTSARLITINVKGQKPVRVLPGNNPAVEISKEAEKLTFTQLLLKKGSLREASQSESGGDDKNEKTEKQQLQEDLEALGVEVKKSWTVPKLKELRSEALEALTAELAELGVEVDADWSIAEMQEELQKAVEAE